MILIMSSCLILCLRRQAVINISTNLNDQKHYDHNHHPYDPMPLYPLHICYHLPVFRQNKEEVYERNPKACVKPWNRNKHRSILMILWICRGTQYQLELKSINSIPNAAWHNISTKHVVHLLCLQLLAPIPVWKNTWILSSEWKWEALSVLPDNGS